ncbi:hypothetical protein [Kibdelosporangium philippinense]|uniref:hypothetical protein n=1 Tax=Kibdelosporangium philippinense TaxID=211113 RepID=UPI0036081042
MALSAQLAGLASGFSGVLFLLGFGFRPGCCGSASGFSVVAVALFLFQRGCCGYVPVPALRWSPRLDLTWEPRAAMPLTQAFWLVASCAGTIDRHISSTYPARYSCYPGWCREGHLRGVQRAKGSPRGPWRAGMKAIVDSPVHRWRGSVLAGRATRVPRLSRSTSCPTPAGHL